MPTYNTSNLASYEIVSTKLSDNEASPIRSEIDDIQKNFDLHVEQKYNKNLVGNIRREYSLIKSKKYIEDLLLPVVYAYNNHYNYLKKFNILTKSVPIVLDDCWVNFQQKYEFNPPHNHDGILSFVMWINVPYDADEERKLSPGVESNYNMAGMFCFLFNDTIGAIRACDIPIDKSMENNIILFPSSLMHMVYPFYSSDGYRISVSGNFKLKVD